MDTIDSIAIHSVDDEEEDDDTESQRSGRCYSQQCQTNMRQTMCHHQALGFSLIFNHWPARHCYCSPLRSSRERWWDMQRDGVCGRELVRIEGFGLSARSSLRRT